MELVRQNWSDCKDEFIKYLKTLGNPNKEMWWRTILNTRLPLMAISSQTIKKVIKEIEKGNWFNFLNQHWYDYHETMVIYAALVTKIEDFNLFTQFLEHYLMQADNWALCDILDFKITPNNALNYIQLSQKYLSSPYTFVRRTGVIILLRMVKLKQWLPQIFQLLNNLENEKEYYVNMAGAWLLCECYIQHKDQTIQYLKNHHTNKFIINKGIQKCRDSYRVTPSEKQMLLQYKVK